MRANTALPLGLFLAGLLLIFGLLFFPLLILLVVLPGLMCFDKAARKFALGMALIVPAAFIYLAVYSAVS